MIRKIMQRDGLTLKSLILIWKSAVEKTHIFLTAEDICEIEPDVETALIHIHHLYGFYSDSGEIVGFIGVENEKIEMLFIDDKARGKGIGKQLAAYAIQNLNAKYVDVNEQNVQGVGFYKHIGFKQMGRSEKDEQGRDFPILHMTK